MPIAKTHKKASVYYLGYYTPWLHHAIDPQNLTQELKAEHRLLFHDFEFIKYIDDKLGRLFAREALLHLILDLEQYRANKMLPIPELRRRKRSSGRESMAILQSIDEVQPPRLNKKGRRK